jgi:hypothetical protein
MANLTDTDLLAVGRGAATYKTTFKNIKDSIGDASTTTKGIVQLADAAAVTAGTAGRVVDAAQLKAHTPANATETVEGIVELATAAETTTGTDATRAVHPAGLKVELDKKVNKAGDTMTGNLTVPSLNGGQLAGTRNVLINGDLRINQRGVNISAAPVGTYGPDRWKRTTGGMTQIVSAENYQPSTLYTLSGTGVTTRQITSPASGDWTIPDVPITAKNIQLEPGPVATPFEYRSGAIELMMCQRYYLKDVDWQMGFSGYGTPPNPVSYTLYYPRMRALPSVNIAFSSGINVASVNVSHVGNQYITVSAQAGATGFMYWVSSGLTIDAEL